MKRWLAVAGILVAVLGVWAIYHPPVILGGSGIEGRAVLGGGGPACQLPCANAITPYTGTFLVRRVNSLGYDPDSPGAVVAHFRSDRRGAFKVALRPGVYVISLVSQTSFPLLKAETVQVESGRYTHVELRLSSGIL